MSPDSSSETPSTPNNDAMLDRHGFRRGQLFAGKYRLEGLLGEGGMGLVLLATHVDLQRTVAIKIVRNELARNDEIVERLLGEAQIAANIRSEHVTRVLDLGRLDSGTPYIVLEYLQGRDLAVLLDEHGPLPFETAVDFLLQVCDALAEAHAAGVIHRDLKPENLFLSHRPDGTPIVKLIDFGISKNLTARDRRAALTNPAQLVGSPYYMAPEQMRGARVVDARADIWALGVVLYELCTGQTPFAADSIPAVCHLVMQEEPTPPRTFAPDLPEELEAVIGCCLQKDAGDRYSDVAELAAALGQFGTPEGVAYVERIQRVLAVPLAHSRRPGSLPDLSPAGGFNLDSPTSGAIQSWRTPLPVAATRNGSQSGQRRPRRRAGRFAWLTLAAGLLFGAAGAAALVVLPSRFRVDEAAADLDAMRSLPPPTPTTAAAPSSVATVPAFPPLPSLSPPETSLAALADEPAAEASSSQPPRAEATSTRRRGARAAIPARTAIPVRTLPNAVVSQVEAPSPAPPPSPGVTTAPAPTMSTTSKPKRPASSSDPWDRRSFGGRR